ncbi:MAG TPA: efflux RND transporter periplasmic adaptor subunit [Methyloversatilis sp.]
MKLRTPPLSLLAAAGLVALLAACSEPSHPDPRTETPRVSVTRVQPDRAPAQAYTGVVSARVQSELGFRVAGKVTERLVDVGQTVKRGQPLMRLDRSDLGLALDAQAFTVSALRARAEQTRADEARLRGLVEQGAISAQAYDQAKAGADSAQALLDSAVAQQKVASNAADYAVLTADVDGVVVDTLAEPGQVVRAGEPVVRLARAGQREALVNLPESVRPGIGSRAQAALHSHPGVAFPARLRQLSDAADARSRTYEARYVLEGDAARAPLGATVTLHLNDAAGEARVSVPIAALYDAGHGTGVWVLDEQGSAVHFRPVEVARLGDETASISAGLKVGERIVAMGAHLLQEGRAVRVTDLPGGRP